MASTATPINTSTPNIPTSDASVSEAEKCTSLAAASQGSPSGANPVAPSPFDKTGADIILRSSNHVDFYVYKSVLLLASDFFETMFSLNQPSSVVAGTLDGRPIIDVSESSDTLDTLLRFCYPVDDPDTLALDKLDHVLAAAIKYELREATKILRRMLQTYVLKKPREVYALACRHNLETEATMAAKRWKAIVPPVKEAAGFAHTLPGATFIPEMQDISAIAYYNLLSYLGSGKIPMQFCRDTRRSLGLSGCVHYGSSPFTRGDADTILRSSDDVDFRVHKLILTMNDGDDFISSGLHVGEVNHLSVLQMSIPASILRELLWLCYPSGMDPKGSSTRLCSDVCNGLIQTAIKYNMKTVMHCIKRNLKNYLGQDHLSRYLIAARHGWDPEAQEAAKCLLEVPLDDVHSVELRHSVASHYHALLEFYH